MDTNALRAEIQDASEGFLDVRLVDNVPMVGIEGLKTYIGGIGMAVALNAIANPGEHTDGQVKIALLFADLSESLTAKAEVASL
jgi:hypothetical protein